MKTAILTLVIGVSCFMAGCLAGITTTVACFKEKGYRLEQGQDDPLKEFARARQEAIQKQNRREENQITDEDIRKIRDVQKRHSELRDRRNSY